MGVVPPEWASGKGQPYDTWSGDACQGAYSGRAAVIAGAAVAYHAWGVVRQWQSSSLLGGCYAVL